MIKIKSELTIQIENKEYRFVCDPDSSIVHAKEAVFQVLKYLGQIEDAANAQQQENKPVEEKKEDQSQVA